MQKEKIARINELARIKKMRPLTEEEAKEQSILRSEYRAAVKASLLNDLKNVQIQNEDGTITDVIKK